MSVKKISIEDYPSLVKLIEDAYCGDQIYGVTVNNVTIYSREGFTSLVTVELDLRISGAFGVAGRFQLKLDGNDTIAEKLRQIIQLEK